MQMELDRRSFVRLGFAAGAAALSPRWIHAQATPASTPKPAADRIAQARAGAATTPIKTTLLADNVYLLQGAGGNMVLQTGSEGNILIDASYATAAPKILEAIGAVSKDRLDALINTHWHNDHTDGNEALHKAGFTIVAHDRTRERLSVDQTMKLFNFTVPASPVGALPVITFSDTMTAYRNGDTLDLVHFDPAHTDSDIYIQFHKADVLHVGDIFFNGMYPFIDEGTGGSIGGMIKAGEKALAVAGSETKIVPGHGPLGNRVQLQQFHDMLSSVRDKVGALKATGASEKEAIAKKPLADLNAVWGKGGFSADMLVGIAYRTL